MKPEEKAAYIIALSVQTYAKIKGMEAENAERKNIGASPAFNQQHFDDVVIENGLHSNALLQFFID